MADDQGDTAADAKPQSGATERARKVAGWTATQFAGLLLTTFAAGSGSGFVLSQIDLMRIKSEIEGIIEQANVVGHLKGMRSDLKHMEGSLVDRYDGLLRKQAELEYRIEAEALGILGKVDVARLDSKQNIHANRELMRSHFLVVKDRLQETSRQIYEAQEAIVANQSDLSGQIEALSNQFESYRLAIVRELKKLQEEGRTLISGKTEIRAEDRLKVEEWIARANYMVRSLVIPTEDGLLRNTSVVKEDLRDAMKAFSREQDAEARVEHARRALWVVEAITDLASGGRIP